MAVKTKSLRRSKPNYIYSIVGVALVLLILGIMGWMFLNLAQAGNAFKENIRISAYLRTRNKDSIAQIQEYITSQPYAKNVEYVNKEKAKDIWNKDNNEDWNKILDFNPLPESIDFYAKAAYVNKDSLDIISGNIMRHFSNQITDLQYPSGLVNNLNERASKLGLIFLVVAIVLCIIVIVSIDTTIRLAMFSIATPMDLRAVVNGLISSAIAIAVLFSLMQWAESQFPQLKVIHNNMLIVILFGGMILIGIGISLFSTHRSVIKYLRMKLDDLY